ncbi:MAG: PIG-L family deacetylase [Candidatus Omnitrophica bacterium]|nr:PIG-L family deacetylase [Candidatus Omnitrophota bacterium]
MKRIIFILFCIIIISPGHLWAMESALEPFTIRNPEPIKKEDHILILAPHPDDEAIGCAGVIQQAVKVGADLRIVYLTNGDHNQIAFIVYEKRITLRKNEFIHMGEVRRKEAIKAMELLGVDENKLTFLGYPDFGTFAIFSRHWKNTKPYRSLLTRISAVPYKENFSPAAPYKGESILNDLKKVILEYKPTKIFVSHPADVNVDHKTFYLFLEIALADLKNEIPAPEVFLYLIHCIGWPLPRRYHPELGLLPPEKFMRGDIKWLALVLSSEELEKKYKAILCYRSQTQSSAFYLLSFARRNELFGDYPEIETRGHLGTIAGKEGRVTYDLIDGHLLICIEKNQELDKRFAIMAYLFGYSKNKAFAEMPKIRIITRHNRIKIFDGRKIIKPEGISLTLEPKVFVLRVPLKVLGEPDFILGSMKSYGGSLPVEAVSLRKIIIRR